MPGWGRDVARGKVPKMSDCLYTWANAFKDVGSFAVFALIVVVIVTGRYPWNKK